MSRLLELTGASCPIKEVIVYSRGGCEVKRIVEIKCDSFCDGNKQLNVTVSFLPRLLSQHSVRVECVGSQSVVIDDLKLESRILTVKDLYETDLRAHNMIDIMRTFKRKREECLTKRSQIKERTKLVSKMFKALATAKANGDQRSFQSMFSEHSNQLQEIATDSANLMDEIDSLNMSIESVGQQFKQTFPDIELNGGCKTRESTMERLIVAFKIAWSTTIDSAVFLELVYQVPNAKWSPLYDWRMSEGESEIDFRYYGSVSQNTEEDWENVCLFLSTADTGYSPTAPDLPTKRVKFESQQRVAARSALNSSRAVGFFGASNSYMAASAPMQCDSMMNDSQELDTLDGGVMCKTSTGVASNGSDVQVFCVNAKTVRSGSLQQIVHIDTIRLEGNLKHYVVPLYASGVYRLAAAVNNSIYTLLTGEIAVFLGGVYTSCTSMIDNVAPGERFFVFLGVDSTIRIEKHSEDDYGVTSGLVQKSQKRNVVCKTTLYNTRREGEVKVLMVQQLPLSNDEKIKVTLNNIQPTMVSASKDYAVDVVSTADAVMLNEATNNVIKLIVVAPETRVTSILDYSIEHPAGQRVATG